MPSPYQSPQLPSARRGLCGCGSSEPARRAPQSRTAGTAPRPLLGNTPCRGGICPRRGAGGASPQCSTGTLQGELPAVQPRAQGPRGHTRPYRHPRGTPRRRSRRNTEPDSSVKVPGHWRAARQLGRRGSQGQRRNGRAEAHRPAPAHRMVRDARPVQRRREAKGSAPPGGGEGCLGPAPTCGRRTPVLPPPSHTCRSACPLARRTTPSAPPRRAAPRHWLRPAPPHRYWPVRTGNGRSARTRGRVWGNGCPCGALPAGSCRQRRRPSALLPRHREQRQQSGAATPPPQGNPHRPDGPRACSKKHDLHHKLQFLSRLECFLSLLSIKDK